MIHNADTTSPDAILIAEFRVDIYPSLDVAESIWISVVRKPSKCPEVYRLVKYIAKLGITYAVVLPVVTKEKTQRQEH